MHLVGTLIVGAISGWLGSRLYNGSGLGLLGNIIVGIFGGFVGYWLLGALDIQIGTGLISTIITSAIGAIVILFGINLIVPGKR